MSLRADLEIAVSQVLEQSGRELSYWPKRLKPKVDRDGALETAKYLLRSAPSASHAAGLQALRDAGRPDLSIEAVVLQPRFAPLFSARERLEARRRLGWAEQRSIGEIAADLNTQASHHRIGALQSIRRQLRGQKVSHGSNLFDRRTIFDDYAFHVGGRTELQFNIGFERINSLEYFRYGVAFSLQTGQSLPSIDPLLSKIVRFNEFVRQQLDSVADLRMWHWDGSVQGAVHAPTTIESNLVHPGVFIFLGDLAPAANVDTESVLDSFDRLLPLYEFVEGSGSFPTTRETTGRFRFTPGRTTKPSVTRATRIQREIDVQLRHNEIQSALYDYLERSLGADTVSMEQDTGEGTLIDIAVRQRDRFWFYEIKTALSARLCIREALGQLLEYAYWPRADRSDGQDVERLIVVGEPPVDDEAAALLALLREKFRVPVYYQQFDMAAGRLSDGAFGGPAVEGTGERHS